MIKKPDWFKEIFSRLATTKQHKLRQEINAWKREQIKELKFFSSQHWKTKKPTPQEQKEFKKKWYWPHVGEINKLASQAFRQINPAEEQLKKLYKQAKNPKYNYRLKLEKGLNVLGQHHLRDKDYDMIKPSHYIWSYVRETKENLIKQSELKKQLLEPVRKVIREFRRAGKAINLKGSYFTFQGKEIDVETLLDNLQRYTSATPEMRKKIVRQFKELTKRLKRLKPKDEKFRVIKGNLGITNYKRRWKEWQEREKAEEAGGEAEQYLTIDECGNIIAWVVNTSQRIIFSWYASSVNELSPPDAEWHILDLDRQIGGINAFDPNTQKNLDNFRDTYPPVENMCRGGTNITTKKN